MQHFKLIRNLIFCALWTASLSSLPAWSYTGHASISSSNWTQASWRDRWDLDFVLISEDSRDYRTLEKDGRYNKFDSSILYRMTAHDDIRLFNSQIYQTYNASDKKNLHMCELSELMYRRRQLLSDGQHGFNLDLELKAYHVADHDLRTAWGYWGAGIPQLVASKKLTSWLSLEGKARHHLNFLHNPTDMTVKEQTRLYFTPTVSFTRQFMFSQEVTWKHKNRQAKTPFMPKKTDEVEYRPSFLYLFNRWSMGELYGESVIARSQDQRTWNRNAQKEVVLGAGLYLSAF